MFETSIDLYILFKVNVSFVSLMYWVYPGFIWERVEMDNLFQYCSDPSSPKKFQRFSTNTLDNFTSTFSFYLRKIQIQKFICSRWFKEFWKFQSTACHYWSLVPVPETQRKSMTILSDPQKLRRFLHRSCWNNPIWGYRM